jgi:hypothetical protein
MGSAASSPSTRGLAAAAGVALLLFVGCGGDSRTGDPATRTSHASKAATGGKGPRPEEVTPSDCPPRLASCRTTEGRIFYVERVDPDGDGDAHFVVVDPQGITVPGATAIDVRRGLRPHPLPGIGDLISAAGPVQTGSYGQSQIHALELHVAGR